MFYGKKKGKEKWKRKWLPLTPSPSSACGEVSSSWVLPVQVLKASANPSRPPDLHSKGNFWVTERVTFEGNDSSPLALLFPSSQVYITGWIKAFTFFFRASGPRSFLKNESWQHGNFKIKHFDRSLVKRWVFKRFCEILFDEAKKVWLNIISVFIRKWYLNATAQGAPLFFFCFF